MAKKTISIMDTPHKFGLVSRILHWLMVGLFLLQFIAALAHFFLKSDNLIRSFFWSLHYANGTLLFVLVILRGLWGMLNYVRRPKYTVGLLGIAARIGHFLLYLLMFCVPLLALLRAYGFGRGFSILGIEIFKNTGVQTPTLMAYGNNFHGEMGWLLLLLILGHIAMVYVHRLVLHDGIDKRMSR